MYEVAEDAFVDGVRYLEVRFSPILHTREGLSLRLNKNLGLILTL